MATEQEYDELISPMLAEVAEKCSELGMALVARVEWEQGNAAITRISQDAQGIEQWLAEYAALARGNFDALAFRVARKFGSGASLVLRQMWPPEGASAP